METVPVTWTLRNSRKKSDAVGATKFENVDVAMRLRSRPIVKSRLMVPARFTVTLPPSCMPRSVKPLPKSSVAEVCADSCSWMSKASSLCTTSRWPWMVTGVPASASLSALFSASFRVSTMP